MIMDLELNVLAGGGACDARLGSFSSPAVDQRG
jgi:hypothetical protein